MTNILIHIAGPTGSGKTTLGSRIKKKYPFILVKDLDEIFKDLPAIYPKEYLKMKEKEFYEKYLEDGVNKFISDYSHSTIIFVGANIKSPGFDDIKYIDIPAKYKFYIEIPEIKILERRFNRHIDFIKDNIKDYFDKTLNEKPLCVDFEKWKKKINANDLSYYKKQDYKFLDNEDIYKNAKQIISKMKILSK